MRKYLFSVSKYCSAQLKLDLEHKIFLSTDFFIILNLLAEEVEGWDDEVVPVKTFLSSALHSLTVLSRLTPRNPPSGRAIEIDRNKQIAENIQVLR